MVSNLIIPDSSGTPVPFAKVRVDAKIHEILLLNCHANDGIGQHIDN
jgi:hypothetical protein